MGLGNITHGLTSIHNNLKVTNTQVLSYDSKIIIFICECGLIGEVTSAGATHINRKHRCKKCKLIKSMESYNGRHCLDYKERRTAVYERDLYTCINCDVRGGKLAAHHIESWATSLDTRFELNNGITFCFDCHRIFHTTYGNTVTRTELVKFLGV
jgi:hypothetical protein